MDWRRGAGRIVAFRHGRVGLLLLLAGESLILIRLRPLSDFYFPVVWFGFVLFLDAAIAAQRGGSLFTRAPRVFWTLIPLSAVVWWIFEWLNLAVGNWQYIGSAFSALSFMLFASVSFSTVLLAVWSAATVIHLLLPAQPSPRDEQVPWRAQIGTVLLGIVCLILPILFPEYAFGLIWGCVALMLDPINCALGRPSMLRALWNRDWHLPLCFALGSLLCGFFWEAWNFWSLPKWSYIIPYVNHAHVFEMPILGYGGYLPFGLELFAMVNFALPFLGLGTIGLDLPSRGSPKSSVERKVS